MPALLAPNYPRCLQGRGAAVEHAQHGGGSGDRDPLLGPPQRCPRPLAPYWLCSVLASARVPALALALSCSGSRWGSVLAPAGHRASKASSVQGRGGAERGGARQWTSRWGSPVETAWASLAGSAPPQSRPQAACPRPLPPSPLPQAPQVSATHPKGAWGGQEMRETTGSPPPPGGGEIGP